MDGNVIVFLDSLRLFWECRISLVRLIPCLLARLLLPLTLFRLATFDVHCVCRLWCGPQPHMAVLTTSQDAMVLLAINTAVTAKTARCCEVTYLCKKEDISDNLLAMSALERNRLRRNELPLAFFNGAGRTKRRQRKRAQTVLVSKRSLPTITSYTEHTSHHHRRPTPPPLRRLHRQRQPHTRHPALA